MGSPLEQTTNLRGGLKVQSGPQGNLRELPLQYTLKNQASSITSRTEQTLFAQSHQFAPPSGRLIKFVMASAAEWCQSDTVRFVCEVENLNQLVDGTAAEHPLEFLGPPQ